MTKYTKKFSAKIAAFIIANLAANEQEDWNMLGNAAGCNNDPEVWERFLDDACHATAWARDLSRAVARENRRFKAVSAAAIAAPWLDNAA
jgi:hypothetical protein